MLQFSFRAGICTEFILSYFVYLPFVVSLSCSGIMPLNISTALLHSFFSIIWCNSDSELGYALKLYRVIFSSCLLICHFNFTSKKFHALISSLCWQFLCVGLKFCFRLTLWTVAGFFFLLHFPVFKLDTSLFCYWFLSLPSMIWQNPYVNRAH